MTAGILLIINERFDLDNEDDDEWNDRLNTAVVCIIFVVLIVNVFVSSIGVDVVNPFRSLAVLSSSDISSPSSGILDVAGSTSTLSST